VFNQRVSDDFDLAHTNCAPILMAGLTVHFVSLFPFPRYFTQKSTAFKANFIGMLFLAQEANAERAIGQAL
jgi:hypothetical protein